MKRTLTTVAKHPATINQLLAVGWLDEIEDTILKALDVGTEGGLSLHDVADFCELLAMVRRMAAQVMVRHRHLDPK